LDTKGTGNPLSINNMVLEFLNGMTRKLLS